jgi:hypothetical protein
MRGRDSYPNVTGWDSQQNTNVRIIDRQWADLSQIGGSDHPDVDLRQVAPQLPAFKKRPHAQTEMCTDVPPADSLVSTILGAAWYIAGLAPFFPRVPNCRSPTP